MGSITPLELLKKQVELLGTTISVFETPLDALKKQVEDLAASEDAIARDKLRQQLRDLQYRLEGPNDTINRFGYYHLQTAVIRIGFNLDLFKLLVESGKPLGVQEIAATVGAEDVLIGRLLRYLASNGIVLETAKDEFASNHLTNNLAQPVTSAGISHCFETIGPQYQELPAFLKKTDYRNPTDPQHTVFQDAWKTDVTQFPWFSDHPEKLKYFNDYMALRRKPEITWLAVYPVQEEAKRRSADPDAPLYVNIGGSIGHQCAQFKEKYPDLPGRVVLQDLAHSVANALPTPGVENTVHNFFDPQPLKGAKFYFFRAVLHNHPDDKVRLVLQNIKAAMTEESVLLLDEWVLPEIGVGAYAASMDLTFLSAFASLERTESQWSALLDSVGLRLHKTYPYNPVAYEAVMDVRLQ